MPLPMFADEGTVVLRIGVTVPPGHPRTAYTWSAEMAVKSLDEAFATLDKFYAYGKDRNRSEFDRAKSEIIGHINTLDHFSDRPEDFASHVTVLLTEEEK